MKIQMVIAAVVFSFSAPSVFAGEITGTGKLKEVKGKSLCAYSGLEDSDAFAPGVVQNFGRHPYDTVGPGGVSDSRDNIPNSSGPAAPGIACNPSGGEPS